MSQAVLLKKIIKECLREEIKDVKKEINDIKKLFKLVINENKERKSFNIVNNPIKKSPVSTLLEQTRKNMEEEEFRSFSEIETNQSSTESSAVSSGKKNKFSGILNNTAKSMTSQDVANIGKLE